MIHNFRHSLEYERSMATRADAFYRDVLGAKIIRRFDRDTDEDMEMQREDVDVIIERKGVEYRISEKFREHDYEDLYIEIYSKYPDTPGWVITGTPNAVLYFFPSSVYWVTHKSLYEFCVNVLFPAIPKAFIGEIFETKKSYLPKTIVLDKETVSVKLVQAHNHDVADWETIGVCVSFDVLAKYGVQFSKKLIMSH
ncbi:MAG: hypothetical protein PHR62_11975 [Paludibacter sp.]|nr:hypothetical protein [Paludibacter sp.]